MWQIPQKCRLCAKITAEQGKQKHGSEGDDCWDSSVCPSRRSHARHRDRRNQTRNQRRQLGKASAVVTLSDSDTALELEKVANPTGVPKLLAFDTQLPVITFTAVLQVYRASVDAPLHAVGGQIWRGDEKEADIISIHCIKLTPRQVEIYLERLLKKLNEAYGIRKFASIEELHPQCCSLPGCRGNG